MGASGGSLGGVCFRCNYYIPLRLPFRTIAGRSASLFYFVPCSAWHLFSCVLVEQCMHAHRKCCLRSSCKPSFLRSCHASTRPVPTPASRTLYNSSYDRGSAHAVIQQRQHNNNQTTHRLFAQRRSRVCCCRLLSRRSSVACGGVHIISINRDSKHIDYSSMPFTTAPAPITVRSPAGNNGRASVRM